MAKQTQQDIPLVRWYRLLLVEKELKGNVAAMMLEVIFQCVFNKKQDRAVNLSLQYVAEYFGFNSKNAEEVAKTEEATKKLVSEVYEQLEGAGIETGYSVDGSKVDEAIKAIDFDKLSLS